MTRLNLPRMLMRFMLQSSVNAHENIQPARLFFETSTLTNANINRSPTSYEANPQDERDRFE